MKLFIFLIFLFCSCKKWLDVEPPNSRIQNELVFASDDVANTALVGIFLDMYYSSGFANGGVDGLSSLAGLSADELRNYPKSDPQVVAFESNRIEADNFRIATLWQSMYKTIYQSNTVIEGLINSKGVSAEKNNQFRGEALFIRAFCHFYLINLFGDVPLITMTDYRKNAKATRTPQSEVYDQIKADLIEAESLLPDSYTSGKRTRPVKAVAAALLARLYLYKRDWPNAELWSTKIISNTTTYSLPDNLDDVFLLSSREAILQLQPSDNASYTNEGYAFSPSVAIGNNVLSDTLVRSFQFTDKRRNNWITKSGALYLPFKYKIHQLEGPKTTEYSMVLRLAEQYFIRAEARARQGIISGNNSSESDINMIRNRAGLPDTSATNINGAINIIENERKLELFTEWGHRWLDLKRNDRATDVLSSSKPNWKKEAMLYPVPQLEINKNPFLKPQNPGYQ